MYKEHEWKCSKMGSIQKAPASTVSNTVAYIFLKKRTLVKSVWAEYVKKERVTLNALL